MEMNVCRKGGQLHMKKILAFLLCAVMTLSLVACGSQKEGIPTQNSGAVSSSDELNDTTNINSAVNTEISNSSENVLIGTWKCLTYDYLIYTFVNDTDLEVFSIDETITHTYRLDGEKLTISDGDSSQTFDIQISGDRFSFVSDDVELVFEKDNSVKEEVSKSSSEDTSVADAENSSKDDTSGSIDNSGEGNTKEMNSEETNGGELSASESQLVGTWECELNGGFYTKTYTFHSDRTGVIQDTSSGLTSQFDLWKYDGSVLYYESNFTYSDDSAGKDIGNLNINLNGETFTCVNLWGEEEEYTKK